jgi:hypothetical protein
VLSKISLHGARAPGGAARTAAPAAPASDSLEAYADMASSRAAASVLSLPANHRSPAGTAALRTARGDDPGSARSLSDGGLAAAVAHRQGSGVAAAGNATTVASTIVDPVTGAALGHFYRDTGADESKGEVKEEA